MNRIILICFTFMLASCSTKTQIVHVVPEMPESLQESCQPLKKMDKDATLSNNVQVIIENYGEYSKCKQKVEMIKEWYNKQKENYGNFDI